MAKVMVVDDAVADVKLMETIIRSAGHEVVSYPNGEGLEDKLVADGPDVLLLDIVMPGRNGYDILRSIRRHARLKSLPVVVVSSKNQASDRVWGLRQGADEYLAKPFTGNELMAALGRFVS